MVVITARRRQSAIISCIHHLLSLPHKTNETFPEEEEKSFSVYVSKSFFPHGGTGVGAVLGVGGGEGGGRMRTEGGRRSLPDILSRGLGACVS